jgi:calcium-translocating P-type ATPase
MQEWHALTQDQVLKDLKTTATGLSFQEARTRLAKIGPNLLQRVKPEGRWRIFVRQIHNPLIYILIVATGLAIMMNKATDGIVILSVAILNTVIGYFQEQKAQEIIQSLLTMIPEKVMVLRGADEKIIPAQELVPGDWVILQAGDRISADLRVVESNSLTCDEAALTGESLPVLKQTLPVAKSTPLSERASLCFTGTLVTAGTGTGVVITTGTRTEFGKVAELLEETATLETPLVKSIKGLAKWITVATVLIGGLSFLIGFFRDYGWMEAALSAVTLAVALIPEGLPAIITISSAIGVRRMAKRKAIIRHLAAVETLGSTSVICSDKTGTLTKNEMTVEALWIPNKTIRISELGNHRDVEELLRAGTLCNDASLEQTESGKWSPVGDPTEIALVVAARKVNITEDHARQKWPRLHELPFDSNRKLMATLHQLPQENERIIYVKGAPEAISQLCSKDQHLLDEQVNSFTQEGMRVIALAKKMVTNGQQEIDEEVMKGNFELMGLQGMVDPPRLEVRDAIEACQSAGIRIKMITGDHPRTAKAIALKLGIIQETDEALTGPEIDSMSKTQLHEKIDHCHVFARVSPKHKLTIVESLQARGKIVAMTGDGVNDAPALKRANIGVAMGISGTAVAKEAADMILADDNFESIEAAVEEGRRVYDNLAKSIVFILPTSVAQALLIFVSVLFFPVADAAILRPMQPVQVLWVNLVVAITLALPLAFEALEPDVMKRLPRRPDAPILSCFIIFRILFVAALMAGGTVGLFLWEYNFEISRGTDQVQAIAEGQTMAVTAIVLFQVFYLLNCRSLNHSLREIGFFSNRMVLLGIGLTLLAQIVFVFSAKMNEWFDSTPLRLDAWLSSLAVAFTIFPLVALEKWLRKNYFD